jgi:hypothetical protein
MKNIAQTLASAAFVLFAAVSAFAQPKIEVKGGDTFDWGTVNDVTKPLAGQVELKNVGDKELIIYQSKPACGCTSDALEKSNLKPGESTTLKFTVNVGSTTGQLMKSISLTTNAAPDSVKVIFLKANIQRLLTVEPQFISFYPLYIGKESQTTAKIKNSGKDPVKLLEFTVNNGLTVGKKTPITVPANGEVEIPIKVTGPAQPGPFYGAILVKTDSKAYPLLEIRSYGEVKPAPTPSPANSPAMLPAGGGQ